MLWDGISQQNVHKNLSNLIFFVQHHDDNDRQKFCCQKNEQRVQKSTTLNEQVQVVCTESLTNMREEQGNEKENLRRFT